MKKACEEKGIWVYVYRDTIEKDNKSAEFLAELEVKEEWLEKYVENETVYRSVKSFLDVYDCGNTKNLYRKASADNAIISIKYTKPVVYETAATTNIFDLVYDAMRALEVAGLYKESEEMYEKAMKADSYKEARAIVSRYINIVRKEEIMVEKKLAINVYSGLNPWIDFVILVTSKHEIESVEQVIEKWYTEWFEGSEKVEDMPLIEYIEYMLGLMGIEYEIYMKPDNDEEE